MLIESLLSGFKHARAPVVWSVALSWWYSDKRTLYSARARAALPLGVRFTPKANIHRHEWDVSFCARITDHHERSVR